VFHLSHYGRHGMAEPGRGNMWKLYEEWRQTPYEDICASIELFAREVMPEFHAREEEQQRWKSQVLEGRVAIEQLDTSAHTVYDHHNEDIVRLTPEQLKRKP